MHIDEFIDSDETDKGASWFFMLARFPARHQSKFAEYIGKYELYCKYNGDRYRVTGASRLGDVWLSNDFGRSAGYDLRVNVDDCDDWLLVCADTKA